MNPFAPITLANFGTPGIPALAATAFDYKKVLGLREACGAAIGLVTKLTPMAVDVGKSVKEAITFVIAVFNCGKVGELVGAALKLGFAVAINSLINGFRAAVSFLFYFITGGSMWKSLGSVRLGLAASFGLAIFNAFEMPIAYPSLRWMV
ncbi:MAG: hypothetical protein NTW21_18345 [Verrucomicrobia bacterium]|nr:hypothetical protein [Verrucomicrobiota bacterium]